MQRFQAKRVRNPSAAARAAGWIDLGASGELRLPSAAHRRVVLAGVPAATAADVGTRALLALGADDHDRADAHSWAGALRRAEALEVCGRLAVAHERLARAGDAVIAAELAWVFDLVQRRVAP